MKHSFLLLSALPLLSLAALHANDAPETPRPNIIFFLVDDMGWMDCGAYGSKYYETPNIDQLARRSMRFDMLKFRMSGHFLLQLRLANPLYPASGPATGSFNGLHLKSTT